MRSMIRVLSQVAIAVPYGYRVVHAGKTREGDLCWNIKGHWDRVAYFGELVSHYGCVVRNITIPKGWETASRGNAYASPEGYREWSKGKWYRYEGSADPQLVIGRSKS